MYLAKLMKRFWWWYLVLVSEEENNQSLFPERADGRVGVSGYACPLPSPSGWLSSLRSDGLFYLDPWRGLGEVPLTTRPRVCPSDRILALCTT